MKTKKEQEELAQIVIDEWNSLFWDNIGKEIDKEKFKENIDFWYKNYLKKPAPEIVYCDSLKEHPELKEKRRILFPVLRLLDTFSKLLSPQIEK